MYVLVVSYWIKCRGSTWGSTLVAVVVAAEVKAIYFGEAGEAQKQ